MGDNLQKSSAQAANNTKNNAAKPDKSSETKENQAEPTSASTDETQYVLRKSIEELCNIEEMKIHFNNIENELSSLEGLAESTEDQKKKIKLLKTILGLI